MWPRPTPRELSIGHLFQRFNKQAIVAIPAPQQRASCRLSGRAGVALTGPSRAASLALPGRQRRSCRRDWPLAAGPQAPPPDSPCPAARALQQQPRDAVFPPHRLECGESVHDFPADDDGESW